MMITTLGASLGARSGSGKAGFESLIVRPITPLKGAGSRGSLPEGSAATVKSEQCAAARKTKHRSAVSRSARKRIRTGIRRSRFLGCDAPSVPLASVRIQAKCERKPDDTRAATSRCHRRLRDPVDNHLRQLGAVRLLDEVAGPLDVCVRLTVGAGHFLLEALVP